MSLHGTCTAVFVAVAAIGAFILSSIRTLSRISWIAWLGVIFIISSGMTIHIALLEMSKTLTYMMPPSHYIDHRCRRSGKTFDSFTDRPMEIGL